MLKFKLTTGGTIMSLKTLTLVAGVIAGTFAIGNNANAQIVTTNGYVSPPVVTTSYYAPAVGWSYYSSPAYYSTPYVSSYYATPYYSSYYGSPYYGGYSYYGGYPYVRAGIGVGIGPRRWWR